MMFWSSLLFIPCLHLRSTKVKSGFSSMAFVPQFILACLIVSDRPVTLIHKPTNGILLDLIECVQGRDTPNEFQPARTAYEKV